MSTSRTTKGNTVYGRYGHHVSWLELHGLYNIHDNVGPPPNSYRMNDNVAPTVEAPILINDDGEQRIVIARWWFQPDWAKSFDTKFSMFNARTDRLLSSKAYKPAFERGQRCLVPMSGFYEWPKNEDGNKQCTFITTKEQLAYSMAGIYNKHSGMFDKDGVGVEYTFTIFTTEPCPSFKPYHNRMPRAVPQKDHEVWMDTDMTSEQAFEFLRPLDEERDGLHWEFTAIEKPGSQYKD